MKEKIEIEQVIADLTKLFEIEQPAENNASFVQGRKFFIYKRKFERLLVIDMLQEYFSNRVINNGYLKVGSITMVFTTFEVLEGKP